MRGAALALLLTAALGACRSARIETPSVGALKGRIEGVERPDRDGRVQVYRLDSDGLPTPDPFETVTPDTVGRFRTRVLSPGRYRVVYRGGEAPPSAVSVRVPTDIPVVLRPLVEPGLVQLRVTAGSAAPVRCRLTEVKPPDGIPDLREFRCGAGETAFLRGLRSGRWYLDLPETAQTTEVDLPPGVALRDLVVDPPGLGSAGGTVRGEIRRADGSPGAWLVVAVRPLDASGATADRWGRYGTTDRSGAYEIGGIPPEPALLRIESREVPIRILPSPHVISIPPSQTLSLGFVVER